MKRRGSNFAHPSRYLADRDVQRRYLRLYMGGGSSSYKSPSARNTEQPRLSTLAQYKAVSTDFNVLVVFLGEKDPSLVLIDVKEQWNPKTSEFIALRSDGSYIKFSNNSVNLPSIRRFETVHSSTLRSLFHSIYRHGGKIIRKKISTERGDQIIWRIVSAKEKRFVRRHLPKRTA